MSTHDDAIVDPWVVLRRLMAENRALRRERDELLARVDDLELQLLAEPTTDVTVEDSGPVLHPRPSDDTDREAAGIMPPPVAVPEVLRRPARARRTYPDLPDLGDLLRPWQREALDAWRAAGHRGVVEAVTGAGKTFVGLAAARDALVAGGRVVVVVPTTELQDQWHAGLVERLPGVRIGRLGGGRQDDLDTHDVLVAIVNSAARRTFHPREDDLLIADECHRYGAPGFAQALEGGFENRLGLTATFEREDDGIEAYLRPYFGGIVFTLWYDRALTEGIIAPFDIALVAVDLSAEEQREYDYCSDRMDVAARTLENRFGVSRDSYGAFMSTLNRLARGQGQDSASAYARMYLGPMSARRGLLAGSQRKLDALALLEPAVRSAHGALVFTQTKESAASAADVFEDAGIPASTLYSGLDREERRDRMTAFRDRVAHLLAAPRVLDEGVDVPEADLAVIVAANRSRRQLVQRLGRVLRLKSDGRAARLVILYARGTFEDPTLHDDNPLASVLPHSRRSAEFSLPDDRDALLRFLIGDGWEPGELVDAAPVPSTSEVPAALEDVSSASEPPVRPFPYQQEILDDLAAERIVHGHSRNLVVMATGTGKTVVSALDYQRLRAAGTVETLLFVAHRKELLAQSRDTFRRVLDDDTFGELFVGGERPRAWQHVFASVQSLAHLDLDDLSAQHFDFVVVDEFHHAEASTYRRLLEHLAPTVLLGLTATPERADGADVRRWFDGRTAVELRLWEALEQKLLSPFEYYGIHDGVPLDQLQWKRGRGYDVTELTELYTRSQGRIRVILDALRGKVADPLRMRALGFCVSVQHARFMAEAFTAEGIPSVAVTSETSATERAAALAALADRSVNVLFTVDLFNEGLDLPAIDTVLFLRPTESATVFLQQLGRGLRLSEDKTHLTVLDFIGAQHRDFRFDKRFRALTGTSRGGLRQEVERGFPHLPDGCRIEMDPVAQDVVVDNIKRSLSVSWNGLLGEVRDQSSPSLAQFLEDNGVEVEDLYRGTGRSWLDLRRSVGWDTSTPGTDDKALAGAFGRLLHIDDVERLEFIESFASVASRRQHLDVSERVQRLAAMLHFSMWGWRVPFTSMADSLELLLANPGRAEELIELSGALRERIRHATPTLDLTEPCPLHLHAHYSRDEAFAAFGMRDLSGTFGSGVRWIPGDQADVFFVTLHKTEAQFSATTMYADRPRSPTLFQWESQSTTAETSPTGQRYVNHREHGSTVHLFLRETKTTETGGTPPFLYAGPMTYESHTGERPMRILWRLEHELPASVLELASTI
ncbi:DUF3427 domain-containing protein [Blastococcus sp. TML/M2B]|uniref:DUF3427 domain-containing protein n=1 Tax=Blastococcus sp. TML/M2B TaxID=2798727 RepID=UPI00190B3ACF|nr:DUF3427 domain-containing protein [Blastococcus sp. TML/M2B]MBN1093331.1 DUF3427 domain-containing protein [Blastococcus sp. TML/M2B]